MIHIDMFYSIAHSGINTYCPRCMNKNIDIYTWNDPYNALLYHIDK